MREFLKILLLLSSEVIGTVENLHEHIDLRNGVIFTKRNDKFITKGTRFVKKFQYFLLFIG